MSSKKHCSLLLSFLVCALMSAQIQTKSTDSLDVLLQKSYDFAYAYDLERAISASNKLIDISLQQENFLYATKGSIRLGSIYLKMKDTTNSLKYYNKSLGFAKKTKSDSIIAGVYNDIGNVYMQFGYNLEEAKKNFEKCIELGKTSGQSEKGQLSYYVNIAWVHLRQNQPRKALPHLNKSVKIVESNKDLHPLYSINLDILRGQYHIQRNNYDRAISLLRHASQRGIKGNYLNEVVDALGYLSEAYELKGDIASAYKTYKEENKYETELNTIIRNQQLQENSAKLRLEQTERELEQATFQNQLSEQLAEKSNELTRFLIITTIVLFIAFLSFFLLFKNRKKYISSLNKTNKELIASKEEAERLSKLKTQFFSTISHELRTPLYGVIGLSSILLEDEKLDAHKEDLKSLKFSADYLLALINDVLTLNKADANGMTLEQSNFNLDTLINNIVSSFTFSLQQNNNKINVIIDEDVPRNLIGDAVKLSQILMNLVGNANKFNENGTIEIVIKSNGKTKQGHYNLKFYIKDNGIGIPKEKQASIFEEFSQVENNNYNYQGTGLGLPIVKKLLKLFGSEINVVSDVGAGSIFSFEISLLKNTSDIDTSVTEIEKEKTLEINAFENIHVLIVDDNKINQKVTQKILEARHFSCELADDGIQAVSKMQKNKYGLVLMDIHMPNMGGIEATYAIRKFNKTTPIIALTAVEIEEMRSQILDSGMNDIILKPYDVSQFLTTIFRSLTPAYKSIA